MGYRHLQTIGLRATIANTKIVSVLVGEGYVQKRVSDLQVGDALVIQSENVRRSLREIEPYLEMSTRYRASIDHLFVNNCAGMRVPRFRIHLLESVLESSNERKAEIYREGGDISPQEYSRFSRQISSHVSVCPQAVRYWMKGVALSPKNWEEFHDLGALNPVFLEWAQSHNTGQGYHSAWRIYTGLRNSLMTALANKNGEGKEQRTRTEGFFAEEIQQIQERFFKEISTTLAVSRILRIDESENEPRTETRDIPTEPIKGVTYQRMNDLRNDFIVLERILWDTLGNYFTTTASNSIDAQQKQIRGFGCLVHLSRFETRHPWRAENNHSRTLEHDLFNGTIDTENQYLQGTTATIVDTVNMLRSALPERYFLVASQKSEIDKIRREVEHTKDRKTKRSLNANMGKLAEKIQRNWQYLIKEYDLFPIMQTSSSFGRNENAFEEEKERVCKKYRIPAMHPKKIFSFATN